MTVMDEKSFEFGNLLKLKVRRNSITGEVLNTIYSSSINERKRFNIFYTIKLFNNSNYNKILICVITEKNRIAELFQKYMHLIISSSFFINSDIAICNDVSTYVNSVNEELKSILTSIGIDTILLPSYSLELNPIELVFNIMAQQYKLMSYKSNLNSNNEI